jgi:hypothetical protein
MQCGWQKVRSPSALRHIRRNDDERYDLNPEVILMGGYVSTTAE